METSDPPIRHIESMRSPEVLPPTLQVRAWDDPLVERYGFDPRSLYVETCWLPVLGPTATWLYRRLGSWLEAQPEGYEFDVPEAAMNLGLPDRLGRHAPISRTVHRLERFGAVQRHGGELLVRRALGPLPERTAQRLTPELYRWHRQVLETRVNGEAS